MSARSTQENLITTLEFKKNETEVQKFSFQQFIEVLQDPDNCSILFNESLLFSDSPRIKSEILTTDENKPSILIEGNASFCSIMLTFDRNGNAVLLHFPLTPPSSIDEFTIMDVDTELVKYRRNVKKRIKRIDNMTILTGHTDSTENNATLVKLALSEFLGQAYANVLRMTEPIDLEEYGINLAHGVVFIPKQLTKNKKNMVFLISSDSTDYQQLLKFISSRE